MTREQPLPSGTPLDRANVAIPCVLGFDSAFVNYAAVTLFSLLVHAEGPYRIYCLSCDLTETDRSALAALAGRFPHAEIFFVEVDHREFRGWNTGVQHVSVASFIRLVIPEAIAEPRAIYLDSDLLVTCDLGPFFSLDLQSAWIAGCVDTRGAGLSRLPRQAEDPYLNSGVLLMDLEQLRSANFRARCEDVQRSFEPMLEFGDQCIINKAAEGRKLIADPRWNVLTQGLAYGEVGPKLASFAGRGVLHFSGMAKPWTEWSDTWAADLWFDYARRAGLSREQLAKRPATLREHAALASKLQYEKRWEEAARARNVVVQHLRLRLRQSSNPERARTMADQYAELATTFEAQGSWEAAARLRKLVIEHLDRELRR